MDSSLFKAEDFSVVVNGPRPKWMSLTGKLASISGLEGLEAMDYCGQVLALAGWSRSLGLRFHVYPDVASMVFNRISEVLEVTNDPDKVQEELKLRR